MREEKQKLLMNLQNKIKKLSSEQKTRMLAFTSGRIISTLANYLIKLSGYNTTAKTLKRAIREIGKKDAEKIRKIFNIPKEDASSTLKIAAQLLGLELTTKGNETAVIKCPYGENVKQQKEPFICNICLEYCNGIMEASLGPNFVLKRTNWLLDRKGCCTFKISKV